MALEGEDCFDNQYYINIRRLLTMIGAWPYVESTKRLPYVSFVTILIVIALYAQIYTMMTSERNVESIIEVLQTFLPTFLFANAYCNLLYNSALVKETLERVKNDWNELKFEDELSIMQRYAAQSKLYSQTLTCLFCFYIIFLISPSILRLFLYLYGMVQQSELILPVHNEVFVATKSIYFIMFSLEMVIILTTCVIGLSNYSMFISLVQHACVLLIFVTNKIDQPFITNEYKCWARTGSKREAELEWIVPIIKHFDNATKFVCKRFVELLTLLYGKISLVEVALGICFLIIDFIYFFQLLNLTMSTGETLKICFYLNGTLLVIYAYCHFGEKLMEHSTSVYAKCRLVPFYKLSVQTNKLFLMLIIRSMKPCNIAITRSVVASHELLAKAMKASFSFATVFYNIG